MMGVLFAVQNRGGAGGKNIDKDTPTYNRWLELIDERMSAKRLLISLKSHMLG
jgi:hypothetical protein